MREQISRIPYFLLSSLIRALIHIEFVKQGVRILLRTELQFSPLPKARVIVGRDVLQKVPLLPRRGFFDPGSLSGRGRGAAQDLARSKDDKPALLLGHCNTSMVHSALIGNIYATDRRGALLPLTEIRSRCR